MKAVPGVVEQVVAHVDPAVETGDEGWAEVRVLSGCYEHVESTEER